MADSEIKMINFRCPVCDSNEYTVMYEDTLQGKLPSFDYNFTRNYNLTFRMVKCKKCTHVFASPRPSNIWSQYTGDKVDTIYLENAEQRLSTSRTVIEYIKKYKKNGKLIDVGCATGDFLSVAKDHYDVEGLELSEWSSKMATGRGFVIHKKLLADMKIPELYDVLTLWGVIEHFEYPKAEIQNIHRILKKDGIVCLWTGDVSSMMAAIMGKKWWYYQGQHIQMFTQKSMRTLFESVGFKTELMGYYPYRITAHSLNNTLSRYSAISKISKPILDSKLFSNLKFTLKLSGEMFAIFRKV